MRKILFALFCVLMFVSCDPMGGEKEPVPDTPVVIPDVPKDEPAVPEEIDYSKDPRVNAFDAVSYEWINYPNSGRRAVERGVKKTKEILDKCNKPGWNYMFYDDEAVLGYEPPDGDYSVMLNAIKITVEMHNLEHPDKVWDWHTCPPPPPPPPVTSNDPILGEWQACLCLDSGEIVDGKIYTAEFDFNWVSFKTTLPLQCESYNLAHPDNKAHVVWGTDKIV